MNTYAMRKVFKPLEIQLWNHAKDLVDRVEYDDCRCHELARAAWVTLREKLPIGTIIVEDGKVGPVEHSWIRIIDTGSILDVYRPGCHPAVLLLDNLVSHDYKVALGVRTDIRISVLERLTTEMSDDYFFRRR